MKGGLSMKQKFDSLVDEINKIDLLLKNKEFENSSENELCVRMDYLVYKLYKNQEMYINYLDSRRIM